MLMDRCEFFAPEYGAADKSRRFVSQGRVWAKVAVAHTHMKQEWGIMRNQVPPAKTLYTITIRSNRSCERGWRVRYRGKVYAVLSEPIFRDQTFHQYFIQLVDEVDL